MTELSERAMKKYAKYIGQRYGDFIVLEVWNDPDSGHQSWMMQCVTCGRRMIVRDSSAYRNGRTKGRCKHLKGCWRDEGDS